MHIPSANATGHNATAIWQMDQVGQLVKQRLVSFGSSSSFSPAVSFRPFLLWYLSHPDDAV